MMHSSNSILAIAAGAMQAHSWGLAVASHNVANVSTPGFEPGRAVYATGPEGVGARLDAVLPVADAARARTETGSASTHATPAQAVYDMAASAVAAADGTDLATSAVDMITTQHAYEANAQVVRTGDAMLGTLLDIKA